MGYMTICKQCSKETRNPKFCSMSCSATHNNNKRFPNSVKDKYVLCQKCLTNNKYYTSAYCFTCSDLIGREAILDKTLEEVAYRNDANKYNKIRSLARWMYKEEVLLGCTKCSYTKHAEVGHRTPISSFPLTTTVREINNRSNIVILCPNCHWEFDNGLLET